MHSRWSQGTESHSRKGQDENPRKKRKLFSFLREHRAQLLDDSLQQELEDMYRETGAGKDPICPAVMAIALIMQGYLGV